MISSEEVLNGVRQAIADTLSRPFEEVLPERSIRDDLGADSLDAVDIAINIENRFDIHIPDRVTEKIAPSEAYLESSPNQPELFTVADVATFVEKLLARYA